MLSCVSVPVPVPHAPLNITGVLCKSPCMGYFTSFLLAQTLGGSPHGRTVPRELDEDLCHPLWAASQGSSGIQGIALAVGLASTKHLEEVWALLEHLGRTKFLRSAAASENNQVGRSQVLEHVEQSSTG